MLYIFDTSSLAVMNHYFPESFPTFWANLDEMIAAGTVLSTREVFNELENFTDRPHTLAWAKRNKEIFATPEAAELGFVAQILAAPRFQALIGQKAMLKGTPVADPFVVAAAKLKGGKVVTQESRKPNAAKIPNVCEHFGIEYTNLEGFIAERGWSF